MLECLYSARNVARHTAFYQFILAAAVTHGNNVNNCNAVTDNGAWPGFPKTQSFFVPWGCPLLWAVPLLSREQSDQRGVRRVKTTKFRAPGLGQCCNQNGCRGGCTETQGMWGCYQCLPPGSVEKGSKHARKDSAGHWPKNYLTSPIPELAQLCLASLGPYVYILIRSQNKCLNKGGVFLEGCS